MSALSPPTAFQQALDLLKPEFGSSSRKQPDGYIDVLGDGDALGPHVGQRIFHSRNLASVYERLWRPVVVWLLFGRGVSAAEERRITLEMLDVSPGDRVIDIGSGPGNYTRHLASAAAPGLAVGVDASEAMVVAGARQGGGPNLCYVRGDACDLPFEDGVFDSACCVGALHGTEDPWRALDEMVRVLAPGGRLAVMTTCGRRASSRARAGLTVFGRDQLTGALAERGLFEVEQRVIRRRQFVAASKPDR